jgi:hypothetical protein
VLENFQSRLTIQPALCALAYRYGFIFKPNYYLIAISASGVRLITKNELESYFTDLTRTEEPRYFRPTRGRIRSASCPSICDSVAVPGYTGSEEYLDSEKYQVRHWALDCTGKPHTQGKTGIATGSPTEFFRFGMAVCFAMNDFAEKR